MPSRLRFRLAVVLVAVSCMFRLPLLADGGTIQLRQRSGPFVITLFSSPVPLRAGATDLSVLVEQIANNDPVLDADVRLVLTHAKSRLEVPASHERATNKLLYAALPELPEDGEWNVSVVVERGETRAEANGMLNVLPRRPAVMKYWPYFAVIPLFVALFALNQKLKRKQRRQLPR